MKGFDLLVTIFDSHNLAHRYGHVMANLKDEHGNYTGIIYGIINLLISICRNEHPDIITFVFDPLYESKRIDGMRPEAFTYQLEKLIQVFDILHINYIIANSDQEADQIIASLVKMINLNYSPKFDMFIKIFSNDHDFWQMINENIVCVTSGTSKDNYRIVDREYINREYDLKPSQLLDLFALTGDRTDGIEGIKGIGPKKGIKLVKKHQDLLGVLTAFASSGKFEGEWQKAWEGYCKMNLLDCFIPFENIYPLECKHLYEREFLWYKDLYQFFSYHGFRKFLSIMETHHLFTGNPSMPYYKMEMA